MKTLTITLAALLTAGCLDAEPDAPETNTGKTEQPLAADAPASPAAAPAAPAAPAAASAGDLCHSLMQRQRACTDTFIPALVQARVHSDNPAGIAAHDRAVGRAALIKEALGEWASDSRDDAIDTLCEEIAQSVSPAKDAQLRTSASTCLAHPSCDAFVPCAVPLSLIRWKE
jgi:hypothetical protein